MKVEIETVVEYTKEGKAVESFCIHGVGAVEDKPSEIAGTYLEVRNLLRKEMPSSRMQF